MRFADGKRDILPTGTKPESARKVILHYLALDDALAEAEEKDS